MSPLPKRPPPLTDEQRAAWRALEQAVKDNNVEAARQVIDHVEWGLVHSLLLHAKKDGHDQNVEVMNVLIDSIMAHHKKRGVAELLGVMLQKSQPQILQAILKHDVDPMVIGGAVYWCVQENMLENVPSLVQHLAQSTQGQDVVHVLLTDMRDENNQKHIKTQQYLPAYYQQGIALIEAHFQAAFMTQQIGDDGAAKSRSKM